jgi:hypothetical protein
MALKKRVSQLRNQLRAAIHLAFPALTLLIPALTQPTSLRFLQAKPTPEAIVRQGRGRFLEQWQPRRCRGQWLPGTLQHIYDLAPESSGLTDPYRIDELESEALAQDLTDALAKQPRWLTQALNLAPSGRTLLISDVPDASPTASSPPQVCQHELCHGLCPSPVSSSS